MDFEFHQRHVVLDKPEYLFELDEYRRGQETFLLVHLRVHVWSPRVFRQILAEWKLFRQCVTAPVFATAEVDDDKWARFVSALGFKFLNKVICANGDQRRLFIHAVQPSCQEKLLSNVRLQQTNHHFLTTDVAVGTAGRCAHAGDERSAVDLRSDRRLDERS